MSPRRLPNFTAIRKHSAESSNELPDLHTIQAPASEVHASLVTEWPPASEVHASVVTEWPPACLHKLLSRGYQRGNWGKPLLEDVSNLLNICSTNRIHDLNLHGIYRDFVLVPGPHGKDRKYSKEKANIGNPKVNSGCPPLEDNRSSENCGKYTWTPNEIYTAWDLPTTSGASFTNMV